jgi:nucleoside 2-deoxyribosyltransferase
MKLGIRFATGTVGGRNNVYLYRFGVCGHYSSDPVGFSNCGGGYLDCGQIVVIYLIGSLRNPDVPKVAASLRAAGIEVFDDWYAAGPDADDRWRDYEIGRGRTYIEALDGLAANHVFDFDRCHLKQCDAALLVLPAGKSGHLELGYVIGRGKRGYILLDSPDRWDVMYRFATKVTTDVQDIIADYSQATQQDREQDRDQRAWFTYYGPR